MICLECWKEYEWHFNSRYCCVVCKREWKLKSQRLWHKSEKWYEAMKRRYKNPKRIDTEKRYRSKPKTKKLWVKRVMKCLKRNIELKKKKMLWDKVYWYKRRAIIKELWWIDYKVIKEKFDLLWNKCLICGSIENIEIDHIIPLSKWGTNDINNLQPLCRSCNGKKWNKILIDNTL